MATQLKNTRVKLQIKCVQNNRLQKASNNSQGIQRIFTKDQQRVLSGRIVKPKRWSDETVSRCLKLQFACGKGYEELRKMGYPLVSRRSLRQRLEVLQFLPGKLISSHRYSIQINFFLYLKASLLTFLIFCNTKFTVLEKANVSVG